MGSDQVWQIPVSPAQRWALFQISHDLANQVQGQESRRLRRFVRAFKIDVIRDVLLKHENRCSGKMSANHTPALLEITAENRDYALHLCETVKRAPATDMVLGSLWDALEATKDGTYRPDLDCLDYETTTDVWTPPEDEASDLRDDIKEAIERLPVEALRMLHAEAGRLAAVNGAAAAPVREPVTSS